MEDLFERIERKYPWSKQTIERVVIGNGSNLAAFLDCVAEMFKEAAIGLGKLADMKVSEWKKEKMHRNSTKCLVW